jgi:hypothetical protein
MKKIIYLAFLSCILFGSSCRADYQHRTGTDRNLDIVLKEFNDQYPDIQPLTTAEIKAAVNDMQSIKSFDKINPYFKKLITDALVPDGVYISYMNQWYEDGICYDIELITICYETSKKEQTRYEMAGNYSHSIRQKYISSRPMTEKEKQVYLESSYIIAIPNESASNQPE